LEENKKWNEDYFYNQVWLQDFEENEYYEWMIPVISGLIESNNFIMNHVECQFMLISRREKCRAGRRFVCRGADQDGNVVNFAEQEQILVLNFDKKIKVFSFVQTRGSLPFLWSSKPTLKWAPKATIKSNPKENLQVC
jgi:hypothetical protein